MALEAAHCGGRAHGQQLQLLPGYLSTLRRPHPCPTPGVPWMAHPPRGPWLLCKCSVLGADTREG